MPARAAALRATTRERIDIDPKTLLKKKTPRTWAARKSLTRWKTRRRNTDQVDLET